MTDLLTLWSMASAATYGIRISTDDVSLLRQQLYRVRADAGGYDGLSIVLPDIPNQLWIVHSDADERRAFDKIHSQPVLTGPGVSSEEIREPGSEQAYPTNGSGRGEKGE